jgi:hypothetical protein
MINQYHDDMAQIAKLDELLTKCKTTGCNQNDAGDDVVWNGGGSAQPTDPDTESKDKNYHNGVIRFPNCGTNISE